MENLHLTKYKTKEFKEIMNWQNLYKDSPELNSIIYYILGGMPFNSLAMVLKALNDTTQIGKDELSLALLAKNENEEIVGAVVADMFQISKPNPELYIQYLIVNPKYQNFKGENSDQKSKNSGNGQQILKELLVNVETFFGVKPKTVFANIDPLNERSIKAFKKLGFVFTETLGHVYTRAEQKYDILLEKNITNKENTNE